MKRILQCVFLAASLVLCSFAHAAQNFTVKSIHVVGLQRITVGTVLNYLPIKVDDRLTSDNSGEVIRALYNTGFFSDVSLSRQGNTLIVKVVERPTIGSIAITGNKQIDTDKMRETLKNLGFYEGSVFNRSVLDNVQHALLEEYYSLGRYNAQVETKINKESRNRVAVALNITEGKIAKIKQIKFIGNHSFSTDELSKQFKLSTPNWLSFFTNDDQYSKEKLRASLEAIQSFYMDRGFIKMKVHSTQVALTPNRSQVYLIVRIDEGAQYKFSGYRITGKTIIPQQTLAQVVAVKPGKYFSRKAITTTNSAFIRKLGNQGYAFSNIDVQPKLDETKKEVFITFIVHPGRKIYVRRINFLGNIKTTDEVLRREMRQLEASAISLDNIQESKRRLNLLGYLENVKVNTKPVAGSNNQVDLDYSVTEAPSAEAFAGIGYGTDGFLFNVGLNQKNFLGTGRSLGLSFNRSSITQVYNLNFYDPYFTLDGIGQGFNLFYSKTKPGDLDLARYRTDTYGGDVYYNIPVAENHSVRLGIGFEHLELDLGGNASSEMNQFVADNGSSYSSIKLTAGWNHRGFDRAIFPTRGVNQNANIEFVLPASDDGLQYFKASYRIHGYHPMGKYFIFSALGGAAYGDGWGSEDDLPFFENYYAGGIIGLGRVRGFESGSLGPRDSRDDPIGGNLLTYGSLGVVFPNFIDPDKIRTTAFIDAGNVFDTSKSRENGGVDFSEIRYSSGLQVQWRTPVAPLIFSIAYPLNKQSGDDTAPFQFTIATVF